MAWTNLECAQYVIECEVAGVARDFLPGAPISTWTMPVEEAERIVGMTVAEAAAIIETEGTIIP